MDSSSTTALPRLKKELTVDVILEILARLPAKSLSRFKCVSKLWYSLILSPHFVALHYSHSHRHRKLSLLYDSGKKRAQHTAIEAPPTTRTTVSFMFGHVTAKKLIFRCQLDQFEMVGCFYGVLCLSLSRRPQIYALWNPATGQFKEIGNAPMECPASIIWTFSWYGSGFCFHPVTNAFKVAQIRLTVLEASAGETRAQVNVFSTDTNSWTEKNIPVPYEIWFRGFSSIIRGVSCVNGYVHWHIAIWRNVRTLEVTFELEDTYILSYNIIDEVFQRIEMPFSAPTDYYHLAQYNGSLAMFVHKQTGPVNSYSEVDVWVLNDCGGGANHSWSKLLTCKPSVKVRLAVGFFNKDGVDLVLFYGEPDSSLYLYDPEAGTTQKFCENSFGSHTFLYSESLASLN